MGSADHALSVSLTFRTNQNFRVFHELVCILKNKTVNIWSEHEAHYLFVKIKTAKKIRGASFFTISQNKSPQHFKVYSIILLASPLCVR